jgi:hypothetical protein
MSNTPMANILRTQDNRGVAELSSMKLVEDFTRASKGCWCAEIKLNDGPCRSEIHYLIVCAGMSPEKQTALDKQSS